VVSSPWSGVYGSVENGRINESINWGITKAAAIGVGGFSKVGTGEFDCRWGSISSSLFIYNKYRY
jgi:hypothetical protein